MKIVFAFVSLFVSLMALASNNLGGGTTCTSNCNPPSVYSPMPSNPQNPPTRVCANYTTCSPCAHKVDGSGAQQICTVANCRAVIQSYYTQACSLPVEPGQGGQQNPTPTPKPGTQSPGDQH